MSERPALTKNLSNEAFRSFYYLKEELVTFCRESGLPTSGGKVEITSRIAHFLESGEIMEPVKKSRAAKPAIGVLMESTAIEADFVCSEVHRAFFKTKIGSQFSFNVAFQKWLKANAGKTYAQAAEAYYQILEDKKKGKTTIDKQFEYNTYIRAFFEDNKARSLQDAIVCWKYKKGLRGHNGYERTDLAALDG